MAGAILTTQTLFIDTNGFLQLKDLKDIRWNDLFPRAKAVDLMVAAAVIKELDKHKVGTSRRQRDRARLALPLIEKASLEDGFALVLKEQPIRVRLVIADTASLDWSSHPRLDSTKPDDQLVAEALAFGQGAGILSHDTGPRIAARRAGIPAFEPLSDWLLPAEQTDEQRKISQLERNLELALSRSPNIAAEFKGINDDGSEIHLVRPAVKPLDSMVVERLKAAYLREHPREITEAPQAHLGNGIYVRSLYGASETQVNEYLSRYQKFEDTVSDFFQEFHKWVNLRGMITEIQYSVRNDSGVAAEGLRIEFAIEGNAFLLADVDDSVSPLVFPTPPSKPRTLLESMHSFGPSIPTIGDRLAPRDPVAFYWFKRPKLGEKESALQCQEFRARRSFSDNIFVISRHQEGDTYSLKLDISAANLPEPINLEVKLCITDQETEWSNSLVLAMLPQWVQDQIII